MVLFQYAEVVYVGYGNKETVWAKDLLPSTGVAAVQTDQPADPVTDQPANPQAVAETKKPVETKPVQEKPPVQVDTRPQAEAVADLPVKVYPVPVKAEALPVKIVPEPVDAAPAKVDAVPAKVDAVQAKELSAKPVSDLASIGAQATKWLKGKSTHSSMSDVSQVERKLIVALKGCETCEYVC